MVKSLKIVTLLLFLSIQGIGQISNHGMFYTASAELYPEYIGSNQYYEGNVDVTTVPITKVSGTTTGDLMIAVVAIASTASITITPPSGWTSFASGTTYYTQEIFYKYATASEPTTYNFSCTEENYYFGNISLFRNATAITSGGFRFYSSSVSSIRTNSMTIDENTMAFVSLFNNVFNNPIRLSGEDETIYEGLRYGVGLIYDLGSRYVQGSVSGYSVRGQTYILLIE